MVSRCFVFPGDKCCQQKAMRKVKLMLSKREWAKRANRSAPWWLFEIYWKFARVRWRFFLSAVSLTRAVYFPVNATYFAAKHLKFGSSYSNYRMRGLSCWHVITRTQLSSFLFPLKPCHANLLNRVDHFLTCVKLRNMESLLVKTYLNCSIVFFSASKGENTPSAVCVNYLMSW